METSDYLVYLSNLRELLLKAQCALHAYCLMTNHVHLLLTPSKADACGRLMRNLGQRYVQYFNRRYERRGTLWEGRYYSCLVDSTPYVIACHRYIERNPVRAGMVEFASDYQWSSHHGNVGLASNKLLTPHGEYLALGLDEGPRVAAYRALFDVADDPAFLKAIRDATNGGFALVGERVKSMLPKDEQRRLERQPPGRRAKEAPQTENPFTQIELELGLRPRMN